jgi:hypothetical protein
VADQPAVPSEPDAGAPATRDDVRSVRRWLVVVAVWAVAASAIGIIALIASNDEEPNESAATNARLAQLERTLSNRIQDLEQEVSKAASPEDVSKLDARLKDLRGDVTDAKEASESAEKTADDLKTTVDDLEQRVEDVETAQQDQNQGQ